MKKVLPTQQLKTGLLDVIQNISALKVKTIHVRPLLVTVLKSGCHSQHDLGRLENFSQKDRRDSGDDSGTCTIHNVLDMRKLSAKWVPNF